MSERFNIHNAIELMRELKVTDGERGELVATVVRATLESANVDVEDLVEQASDRQRDLQHDIDALQAEISQLEQDLTRRHALAASLEVDRDETADVQRKLERALDRAELRETIPPPAARAV